MNTTDGGNTSLTYAGGASSVSTQMVHPSIPDDKNVNIPTDNTLFYSDEWSMTTAIGALIGYAFAWW